MLVQRPSSAFVGRALVAFVFLQSSECSVWRSIKRAPRRKGYVRSLSSTVLLGNESIAFDGVSFARQCSARERGQRSLERRRLVGHRLLQMDTHPEELTESQRSERSRVRGYKQRSRPPQRHRASIPRHPSTTIRPDQARLFVAFEAPSVFVDAATTAQQFFQDHWRADRNSATDGLLLPARPPVRWTSPDSWHVTLHFMGTTPRELVPQVTKRLDEIASQYPPITLVIKTIAGLPPPIRQQRLRVICLEIAERVSGTVSTLPVLVNALAAQLAQFSITIDPADEQRPLEQAERKRPHASTKPYTPHLTLGRVKDWANSASVEQLWSLIQLASNGAWSCTRTTNVCFSQFTLYESVWERESSSPLYKPLGHFMLRNGEATTA